jgi:hypothetical protein
MITISKIAASFRHRPEIPVDFALAIYRIMHNQAGPDEWELIDRLMAQKQPVFDWIRSILEDNGVPDIEAEMQWWANQITYPSN